MGLTHFNEDGEAWMVDVTEKQVTVREAEAKGMITMNEEAFQAVQKGTNQKGDVLATARIAGIMGAKQTSSLIPLCHPIPMTRCTIEFELLPKRRSIVATCKARTEGKTGIEMETLTGVNVALLTIYDMCKALDKKMVIGHISLIHKTGGKSGEIINDWKEDE
ncbi:MAG: cyclic pyranopterin monophosphate synthase MoaC [Lachnospiraceae bacterium]|nr:cyclic pyranopterin monophosphate synthase MoaC [Lachnospiraceae bacterium]